MERGGGSCWRGLATRRRRRWKRASRSPSGTGTWLRRRGRASGSRQARDHPWSSAANTLQARRTWATMPPKKSPCACSHRGEGGARSAVAARQPAVAGLRQLPDEDGAGDSGGRARARVRLSHSAGARDRSRRLAVAPDSAEEVRDGDAGQVRRRLDRERGHARHARNQGPDRL
jgi:hypothetical protein